MTHPPRCSGFLWCPQAVKPLKNVGIGSSGISATDTDITLTRNGLKLFEEMMANMFTSISAASRAPWQFNSAWAWQLDKANGKSGPASVRLVFGVPTLSKHFLSVLYDQAYPPREAIDPDWAFHCKGRRTEEAIAIQMINGLRLSAASVTHLRNFRDTCNAFGSISHASVLDTLDDITDSRAHDPLSDHVQQNVITFEVDGHVYYYRADCGPLLAPPSAVVCSPKEAWVAQSAWVKARCGN